MDGGRIVSRGFFWVVIAASANRLLPLGVYPLLFLLAMGGVLALILWRVRLAVQAALAQGAAPAARETEQNAGVSDS